MYYKIFIYLYTFTLLLSLILFYRYLKTKQNQLDIPTKTLFRDDIQTGDVFLLDWQRTNNVFIASFFNNSFMHPAIAVWENNDLFMVELINYFNDEKYKGLIKVPFNKWYRINRRALFLYNKLTIKDDKDNKKRDEIKEKILKFYLDYKGKMGTPKGFSYDWIRFWYPSKEYKTLEKFDNVICTEVLAFLLKEIGIAKKSKSLESYTPDSFIAMKDFDLEEGYSYKESSLVEINEL